MAIPIISAWLLDGFDPKLAPWFATCKIDNARHRIEEERRKTDAKLEAALVGLRKDYKWCVNVYADTILYQGRVYLAWRDDVVYTDDADRGAVMMMHEMCQTIGRRRGDTAQKLRLARRLQTMMEQEELEVGRATYFAMRQWAEFNRARTS